MPIFSGCEKKRFSELEKARCTKVKFKEYIDDHLVYPQQALAEGREGKCLVEFVINSDGTISNVEVQFRKRSDEFAAETYRVFEEMNKSGAHWIPGKYKDKTVRVQYYTEVEFKI